MVTADKKILVTGGSGYVGSHCVVALLEAGYHVVVLDNCSNSALLNGQELPESLKRVEKITEKRISQFYNGNTGDEKLLDQIFSTHSIEVVMHFAALKSVGESVKKPLDYYRNNVSGSVTLLMSMQKHGVDKFIFSSSATVYGKPSYLPLDEKHSIGESCSNPYGRSKYMVEQILMDVCTAEPNWSVISLRYFNPIGAHESGLIGEDPNDIPNNLMPYISQVAVGIRPHLNIFGDDYNTPDGTGIRDYIHIDDLSSGHIAALKKMLSETEKWKGFHPINLGTGQGTSVLELVKTFEKATGVKIPYEIVDRRPGDQEIIYSSADLAKERLGWKATKSLMEMCTSTWKWQSSNPNGFRQTNGNQC